VNDQDVLAFVAASIRSVWALELLLFLKQNPARAWNPDALIRELRSSSVVIAEALASLQHAGLVVQGNAREFRYTAASATLDQVASDLERLYAAKPLLVIDAIVSSSTEQLRRFSDAFKFKD